VITQTDVNVKRARPGCVGPSTGLKICLGVPLGTGDRRRRPRSIVREEGALPSRSSAPSESFCPDPTQGRALQRMPAIKSLIRKGDSWATNHHLQVKSGSR
jgi:hypothetical protein